MKTCANRRLSWSDRKTDKGWGASRAPKKCAPHCSDF